MTVQKLQVEFLQSSEARLAPEDFFVLLAHATNKDKTFLLAHPEYALDAATEAKVRGYFTRRLTREPVAYIVGHKEFYGRDFLVTPDTLIPRPETELLAERIIDRIKNKKLKIKNLVLVDVGTGSGNIIITLASELSDPVYDIRNTIYEFFATDISSGALKTARENAKRHGLADTISFHEGNLLEPLMNGLAEADEIIIAANLPYLSKEIYQASHDDVRLFEPETALVSEAAGLDHYYRLFEQVETLRKPTTLFLEISPEQTPIITDYLVERFPQASTQIHQDLSGRDRIVEIHLA